MKRFFQSLTRAALILFCVSHYAAAQQTFLSAEDLKSFLDKSAQTTEDYVDSFKNLVAEELKTIEKFRKDGNVEETRRIKSTFIVYQLQKENKISEFRSVIEFNNKKVGRSDEDAVKFFENLAKPQSAEKELLQIQRESTRYDGPAIVWGVTLGEGFVLNESVRPVFTFQIAGKEQIENRSVLIVEYKQTKASPLIVVNPRDDEQEKAIERLEFNVSLPSSVDAANARLSGRLWLDAETGQIWKDSYQVTIDAPGRAASIPVVENQFEYQSSKFNVLVPKKFVLTSYQVRGKNDDLKASKFLRTSLEYSAFNGFNAEIDDYQIKGMR